VLAAGPVAAEPPPLKPPADVLLPPGAVRQFGERHFRHPGGIHTSALSADGKWLATAGSQSVIVWSTATGEARHRFNRTFGGIGPALAFFPDGTRLAAGSATNGDLFIWDLDTGKESRIDARGPDAGAVRFLTFTPDGRQLVVGTHGATDFRDATTWKVVRSVAAWGRAYSPVGPAVISQTAGGRVCLSDANGDRPTIELGVEARSLEVSPDGKLLLTLSVFGVLDLWSIPDGRRLRSEDLRGDLSAGRVAFAPDGRRLFVSLPEGITERETETLRVTGRLPGPAGTRAARVLALPDGDALLVCGADGRVIRYSRKTEKPVPGQADYSHGLHAAATRDGRVLAIGDESGRVDLWDATTGKRTGTVCESGPPVSRLAFAPDGRSLAIGRYGRVEVRDLKSPGDAVRQVELGDPKSGRPIPYVRVLDVGPDGRVLWAVTGNSQLRVWDRDAETGRPTGPYEADVARFTPDGREVAFANGSAQVVFLDARTGAERSRTPWAYDRRESFANRAGALAFSPDGRRLAVATEDGRYHLFDPATGRELTAFPPTKPPSGPRGFASTVGAQALAFSADGNWFLTGGYAGVLRIWEVATRREAFRLAGHEGTVTMVAFGPGGKTILSAGTDGAVYQWDLRPSGGPRVQSTWDDLAADDPAVGYRAVWALIDDPAGAVRTLRAIAPVAGPTPAELAGLIARLNADQFAVREAATRALADLGPLALPALKAAQREKLSAEAGERVAKLLDRKADELTPAGFRAVRAVQVLERIGTAEAKTLLAEWSAGADGATLTEEARGAAKRLKEQR
jgi:WD40 repeat protein